MTDRAGSGDARVRVADELLALIVRVDVLAAATDAAAWTAPPPSGGWSAAECLEHLSATAEEASRRLVAAPQAPGRSVRRAGPRWWVRLFARSMEPPARFRSRTKASFVPRAVPPMEAVLDRFRTSHRHLADDVASIPDHELHRVSIDSPFGPVRYTPLEWALVLAAHGRRHVWQAERAIGG